MIDLAEDLGRGLFAKRPVVIVFVQRPAPRGGRTRCGTDLAWLAGLAW
jgi:hypothetical protein